MKGSFGDTAPAGVGVDRTFCRRRVAGPGVSGKSDRMRGVLFIAFRVCSSEDKSIEREMASVLVKRAEDKRCGGSDQR